MLKNNKFFFTKVATKEFDLLKQVLSSSSVLSLPDFSQPFAIGAVLMQNQHPLSFISQALYGKYLFFHLGEGIIISCPCRPKVAAYLNGVEVHGAYKSTIHPGAIGRHTSPTEMDYETIELQFYCRI